MSNRFRFVNGDGGTAHEDALQKASGEGYAVKLICSDPSIAANNSGKPIVVLMERVGQGPSLSKK